MESPDLRVHRSDHRTSDRHQPSQDTAQDEDQAKHLLWIDADQPGSLLVFDYRSYRPPQGGASEEDEQTRKGNERYRRGYQASPPHGHTQNLDGPAPDVQAQGLQGIAPVEEAINDERYAQREQQAEQDTRLTMQTVHRAQDCLIEQ